MEDKFSMDWDGGGDGLRMLQAHSAYWASPPQLHLRSSGVRFPYEVCNREPSHAQVTVEFALLWKSNPAADLTGGGVQEVIQAAGAAVNTDDAWLPRPPLTSCCAAQSLTGHRLEAWVLGTPSRTGWIAGRRRGTEFSLGDQWENDSSCTPGMFDRVKWKWKALSCVQLFAAPWTTQSTEFSRPEHWSG